MPRGMRAGAPSDGRLLPPGPYANSSERFRSELGPSVKRRDDLSISVARMQRRAATGEQVSSNFVKLAVPQRPFVARSTGRNVLRQFTDCSAVAGAPVAPARLESFHHHERNGWCCYS